MKKKLLIISVTILIISLISVGSFYYYKGQQAEKQKQAEEEKLRQSKEKIINQLEQSEEANIVEDGFEVSYLSGEDKFIITIRKNPYKKNKEDALSYLKLHGIDPEKINLVILTRKGVDVPPDEEKGSLNNDNCDGKT